MKSDVGQPLAGATLSRDTTVVATTGADGKARFDWQGYDGQSLQAALGCPSGFTSPSDPVTFKLAKLADPGRVVEVEVVCPRAMRKLVVAVKAENGANLPIKVLNQVVARTDESGAATFQLDVAPQQEVQVVIDTSDHPKMRPESPTIPVSANDKDDIKQIEQRFELPKKKVVVVKKTDPRPKCIGCG